MNSLRIILSEDAIQDLIDYRAYIAEANPMRQSVLYNPLTASLPDWPGPLLSDKSEHFVTQNLKDYAHGASRGLRII